jgi:uncharacterized protein
MRNIICALYISVVPFCFAGEIQNKVNPIPLQDIRLEGFLGEKINLVIKNRIKIQDPDYLIQPFRNRTETRWWQSEFWGKWFLSAVDAYKYTGDPELLSVLESAVTGLIETQTPDGYIGNYAPNAHLKAWDVWGRKYSLLGLLAYYDLTKDNKVLAAAQKLADHLLFEVGPGKADIAKLGNHRGMAAGSILGPIVLLYNRTGKERYLAFANYIVQRWESEQGPQLVSKALGVVPVAKRFPKPKKWWTWDQGQKAYEMMSCYDGLAEFYRTSGNEDYLQACDEVIQNIVDTEINAIGSGASVECWYEGKQNQAIHAFRQNETCVTMTWIKFLFQLYKLTGDPSYIDCIEKSVYNALLASMAKDGSTFAKYTPLSGVHSFGEDQCGMTINCCTANGPRALLLIPQIAYMKDNEGLVVNLYGDGKATASVDGTIVTIKQTSDYPKFGKILLEFVSKNPVEFKLKLRIPKWSENTIVRMNGNPIKAQPDSYAGIFRRWKTGDKVELELDMQARISLQVKDLQKFVAIERGPVVLARDKRFDVIDEDEVTSPVLNKNGNFGLLPVQSDDVWMLFKGQFIVGTERETKHKNPVELHLCDFASAGNTWDYTSRYRVWLPQLYDPSK